MKTKLYVLFLIAFSVFSCSKEEEKEDTLTKASIVLNEVFELKIGEQAVFEGNDLCFELVKVIEDSRCPDEIDCVWGGRAWIELNVTEGSTESTINLITENSMNLDSFVTAVIGAYEIVFYGINPSLSLSTEIMDEDYVVSLRLQDYLAPVCDNSVTISNEIYDTISTENYTITAVEITDHCLDITVAASGCDGSTWVTDLVDSAQIAESLPEQRYIKLHLSNQEICAAALIKTLSFDISETQTSNNEIIINLEGWEETINYQY